MRNVETSRSNIGCNKATELIVFEPFQCHFASVLRNVTMHNLDALLNFVGERQLISISLRRREYDRLALATVTSNDVSQNTDPLVLRTGDHKMLHLLGSLVA